MFLASAVVLGLGAAALRAGLQGKRLWVPDLRLVWLVPVAFAPQFLAFFFAPTRSIIPDWIVPYFLISSQALLLFFAVSNLSQAGFWAMLCGTAANLLVILFNGGWMPISPSTVIAMAPDAAPGSWMVGERLGFGKDIVLAVENTRLWFLSDRFLTPSSVSRPVAFSIGDVLLAGGAFWFLWSLGSPRSHTTQEKK